MSHNEIHNHFIHMCVLPTTKRLRDLKYPSQIIGVSSRRLTEDEYGEFYNAGLDDLRDEGTPLSPDSMKFIVTSVLPSKPSNGHQN